MSKEKEFERIKNLLPYAKGIERDLIEGEAILLNNELARETLKKLKKDFWYNIIYIIFGFSLGLIPTLLNEDRTTKEVIELTKSITEKSVQEIQTQTEVRQMRLEITSLRKELDSLKIE